MISGLQLKKTSVSLQEVQDLKDKVEAVKLPRDRSVLLLIPACLLAIVYAMCWLVFYDKFFISFMQPHAIPLPKWLIPAGIRCQKLLDMKSGSNRATMATGRTGRIEERPQIVSRYMDLMEQEN